MNSQKKHQVLIVVPTYNNQNTLLEVIHSITSRKYSLLVINDGSTDDTSSILKNSPCHHYTHQKNLGKGAALKTGFQYAMDHGYTHVVSIDSDGQHSIKDIKKLVECSISSPECIVIGSRNMTRTINNPIPFSSIFGRWFSNFWVKIETSVSIIDTQSGMRCYPINKYFLDLSLDSNKNYYDFEIEILVKSIWSNIKIKEVPVEVFYPIPSKRVSHFNLFKDNFRLTQLHTVLVYSKIKKSLNENNPKTSDGKKGSGFTWIMILLFGKTICYGLSVFPIIYFYLTDKKSRNSILEFYERLESKKPNYFRGFINYWLFSLQIVDRFYFLTKKSKIINTNTSKKNIKPGSIILGSHIGDWLFGGLRLNSREIISEVSMVVDLEKTPKNLSKILKSKEVPVNVIDANQDGISLMLEIKSILGRGGIVCLMADRVLNNDNQHVTDFLKKQANFPQEPFRIAKALNAPLYAFLSLRDNSKINSEYSVDLKLVSSNPKEEPLDILVNKYVNWIESKVKDSPEHWFNFFPFWQKEATFNV